MSEHHESPIKTPKQLITVIVLAFVVPIALIILLANWVSGGDKNAAGSQAMSDKAINQRLAPIATTEYGESSGAAAGRTGEQIYKAVCAGCHDSGAANAPKMGDKGAWSARIGMGFDKLTASAIKGKGAMPAKGGDPSLTDIEMQNVVAYIANAAGANFKPAAPATPVAAPAKAATATPTAAVPAAAPGKALYDSACAACHNSGVAGAPKFADKAAWAPRAKAGVDALTASAIKGKGGMPPKGGTSASDAEIKAAVQYILSAAK